MDLAIVFRGRLEPGEEERARLVRRHAPLIAGIFVDLEVRTDAELQKRGDLSIKLASTLLYGESRDFLEFHHIEPWARSKRHSVRGIELRCRAHNHHAAVQDYGAAHMERCLGDSRRNARASTRPGAS